MPKRRVLLLEWTDPPMTAGHWTPGLIEAAGGDPVLGHAGKNSQAVTFEAIEAADPEVIVLAPCGFGMDKTRECLRDLERLPQWQGLRAVRSGSVACVDGSAYVNRPGPRLVDTIEILADILR
ncbi:MAG: ABC transporter substrate-binding protein [Candidatus Baltobacteraceae bacterium]